MMISADLATFSAAAMSAGRERSTVPPDATVTSAPSPSTPRTPASSVTASSGFPLADHGPSVSAPELASGPMIATRLTEVGKGSVPPAFLSRTNDFSAISARGDQMVHAAHDGALAGLVAAAVGVVEKSEDPA